MADDCKHPMEGVVPHPTRPGKSYCHGCGRTGEIWEKVGPFVFPKAPTIERLN
jgi:hypothetical protein